MGHPGSTLAVTLLGIETAPPQERAPQKRGSTLAVTLLGIETGVHRASSVIGVVPLWL